MLTLSGGWSPGANAKSRLAQTDRLSNGTRGDISPRKTGIARNINGFPGTIYLTGGGARPILL
jgi:hypothetical protein